MCVAACCFKQPKLLVEKKKLEQQIARESQGERLLKEEKPDEEKGLEKLEDEKGQEENKCCSWGPDFKFSLLKNPRFTLYALAFLICSNGYNNNLVLIPAQTRFLGYGKSSVALTVSVMGACEVWARILVGWIADKKWLGPKHIFSICFLISSIFAFITPFFNSITYMCVYAAVIGIFPASFWSLIQVLMIDVVGMKDFPPGYGLTILGLGIGAFVSQPLIGNYEIRIYSPFPMHIFDSNANSHTHLGHPSSWNKIKTKASTSAYMTHLLVLSQCLVL